MRYHFGRWVAAVDPLCICIEDVDLVDGVRLTAEQIDAGAEEAVLGILQVAAHEGVMRQEICATIAGEGFTSDSRLATKILGKLHARGVVKKRKIEGGREMQYWLRQCAPQDAN